MATKRHCSSDWNKVVVFFFPLALEIARPGSASRLESFGIDFDLLACLLERKVALAVALCIVDIDGAIDVELFSTLLH